MWCLPAGAAVGEVQQDLQLIGISIGNDAACPTVYAANGVVYKSYGAEDYPIGSQAVYFYFNAPPTQGDLKVNCTFGIAADLGAQAMFWCAYASTGFNQGSLVELQDVGNGRLYGGNYAGGLFGYQFTGVLRMTGDYQYIVIVVYPSSTSAVLQRGIDFASSGMVSQSGSASGTVSQSGSFGSDDIVLNPDRQGYELSLYTSSNTTTPIWQYYDQYGTIYNKASDVYIAHATVIFPYYSGSILGSMSSSGSSSSSISTSGTVSQSITASAPNNIMAYGVCAVSYGDDGGLQTSINNQTNVIQQEQDQTQQAINNQGAQTQQTIKEETEKQTSKIGGFFDKLLGGIKDFFTGLFIPDEIATDAFTDLLENKLGFIYQVPAIVVSFFTTLFGAFANGSASAITFPGWSFGEWTFLAPATINRSDYSAIFSVLDPVLTIVGTILVVFAFCKGVQSFYERILGGGKE